MRWDNALVAWLASRGDGRVGDASDTGAAFGHGQDRPSYGEAKAIDDAFDALDATFEGLMSGVRR